MKQSDIAIIILVVAISLTLSFFLGGSLISTPESRSKEIIVIEEIDAEFPLIGDEEYAAIFNTKALNPAVNIRVGESDTNKPFINN